jgi:antitoxin (DNA-binding transcriptional repressor) of toxin-antitoxin stability system
MKTVGVRELKNRLSEYLRLAKAGDSVLVTDRGQVVAELAPPGHGATDASVPAGLLALARRNLLVIGAPADSTLYPALPRRRRRTRTAAQLLQDERGDR